MANEHVEIHSLVERGLVGEAEMVDTSVLSHELVFVARRVLELPNSLPTRSPYLVITQTSSTSHNELESQDDSTILCVV